MQQLVGGEPIIGYSQRTIQLHVVVWVLGLEVGAFGLQVHGSKCLIMLPPWKKKKTLNTVLSVWFCGSFFKTKTNFGVNTVREIGAKWKPHSHHLRHIQGGALSSDDEDFIVAKIMLHVSSWGLHF